MSPHETYDERLQARRARLEELERTGRSLSLARALSFFAALLCGLLAWGWPGWIPGAGVLGGLAAFFVFVVLHWRNRVAVSRAREAVRYYHEGIARLEGEWAGRGTAGSEYLDAAHPYAQDLDLFGEGSLFERLCTARTRAGEQLLADWLREAASPDEVRQRQEAVSELTNGVDLREDLAVRAGQARAVLHPDALVEWAGRPGRLPGVWVNVLAAVVSAAALVTVVGWGAMGWGALPFALSVMAVLVVGRTLKPRVDEVLDGAEASGEELEVLARVLERFEAAPLEAPALRSLRDSLSTQGRSASARIAQLGRWVTALEAMKNQFFAPLGWLLLWRLQCARGLESWRREAGMAVAGWLDAVGELEALSSLATFAFENPENPFPEIVPDGSLFDGKDIGHPLLPDGSCIRNDVCLDSSRPLWVVSGSNMSGKSTLLRTVGVNVVLALAGAPVRASSLRVSPLQIGATLRVQDSLSQGISRFYAEIRRLRQIMDLADGERPLLFLLDEILHGTNSHDRKIGADAVVRALVERGAVGLVTTHDLALARTADEMERARNVHFEDQLVEGKLTFDYRLREGVVTRSNALELMRAVGLEV